MTVSYQSDVASSTSGGLIKLLWRWRGSVWKLVYKELFLFQIAFISLQMLYNYVLDGVYKDTFKWIVVFCSGFVDMIPLSFILGFYVSFIATRWWNQYTAIPWPDKLMNNIALYIPGNDETSRMLRRTLMRYANLSLVLVLRSISIAVKRRFPTREHLIEAGFMNKNELDMFSAVPSNEFNTFWIPCTWFVSLLREARQNCRITDSCGLKIIMEELNEFRNKCGLLWSYDWVSIPLVYTQVVTLATYCFFVASLFGRQYIDSPFPSVFDDNFSHKGERFIPLFSTIQFLLYMGLLKLGEQLINPFGDDDEDFELNWIIDRHIKVSFLGVDILNARPPPLTKDNYFHDTDIKLPYTAAAVSYKKKTYRGSMAAYHVPSEQQGLVVPEFVEDYNEDDFLTNTLHSSGSKNQSSLWSVFNKVQKPQSVSLLSLDSENLGNFKNWEESVEKSSESYFGDPNCIENSSINNLILSEDNDFVVKNKNESDFLDEVKFNEEVYDYNENIDKQKKKGNLSKQSSQESQNIKGSLNGTRKVSDIHSTSSILKTRIGNDPITSQNKAFLFDMQLVAGAGKVLSSMAKEYHQVQNRKSSTDRKQALYKINKVEDSSTKLIDTQGNRLSISSLKAKQSETNSKNKPSMFKKVDPKLKIKPFKSKVTFLDQMDIDIDKAKKENLIKCIPDLNKNLNIEKYDLSASSPELNKNFSTINYPYIKAGLSQTESDNQLETIKNAIGSLSEIQTSSDLLKQKCSLLNPRQASKSLRFETIPINDPLFRSRSSSFSNINLDQNTELDLKYKKQSTSKITEKDVVKNSQSKNSLKGISENNLKETTIEIFKNVTKKKLGFEISIPLNSQCKNVEPDYKIDYDETFKNSKEYWLRHQSLPNIQELVEETNSDNLSSPTSKETLKKPLNLLVKNIEENIQIKSSSQIKESKIKIKKNAEERRSLYFKARNSSSSSFTSQKRFHKKTLNLNSSKTNSKQSSTESETSTYFTAHSVYIPIPEIDDISSESLNSSANLSYYSASELLNLDNLSKISLKESKICSSNKVKVISSIKTKTKKPILLHEDNKDSTSKDKSKLQPKKISIENLNINKKDDQNDTKSE